MSILQFDIILQFFKELKISVDTFKRPLLKRFVQSVNETVKTHGLAILGQVIIFELYASKKLLIKTSKVHNLDQVPVIINKTIY